MGYEQLFIEYLWVVTLFFSWGNNQWEFYVLLTIAHGLL